MPRRISPILVASLSLLAACGGDLDAGNDGATKALNSSAGSAGSTQGGGSGTAGGETADGQGGSGGTAGAAAAPAGGGGQGGTDSITPAGQGGTTTAGSSGASDRKHGHIEFGVRAYDSSFTEGAYLNGPYGYFHEVTDMAFFLSSCQAERHGDCELFVCPAWNHSTPPTMEAGTITFTGGLVSPVVANRNQDTYSSLLANSDTPIVTGGEVIQVSASGGVVPAFSLTGTIPDSPLIDGLPADGVLTPAIDASQDIQLSLSGGTSGTLRIVATAGDPESSSGFLFCTVPASSSSFTVPAAALTRLKSISPQGTYNTQVFTSVTTQVGDWDIDLELVSIVKDKSGTPYHSQFAVTYQ